MLLNTFMPLFIQRLGGVQIVLIILLVVVLFGAKRIPELMKGVGKGIKEFKDALNGDRVEKSDDNQDSSGKQEIPKK